MVKLEYRHGPLYFHIGQLFLFLALVLAAIAINNPTAVVWTKASVDAESHPNFEDDAISFLLDGREECVVNGDVTICSFTSYSDLYDAIDDQTNNEAIVMKKCRDSGRTSYAMGIIGIVVNCVVILVQVGSVFKFPVSRAFLQISPLFFYYHSVLIWGLSCHDSLVIYRGWFLDVSLSSGWLLMLFSLIFYFIGFVVSLFYSRYKLTFEGSASTS